jgi:hypothetical protein
VLGINKCTDSLVGDAHFGCYDKALGYVTKKAGKNISELT